jgi:hypothetical protein
MAKNNMELKRTLMKTLRSKIDGNYCKLVLDIRPQWKEDTKQIDRIYKCGNGLQHDNEIEQAFREVIQIQTEENERILQELKSA